MRSVLDMNTTNKSIVRSNSESSPQIPLEIGNPKAKGSEKRIWSVTPSLLLYVVYMIKGLQPPLSPNIRHPQRRRRTQPIANRGTRAYHKRDNRQDKRGHLEEEAEVGVGEEGVGEAEEGGGAL